LVNTHHHLFQNLTRAFAPAVNRTLFGWLQRLYPVWAGIDTERPTCPPGSGWWSSRWAGSPHQRPPVHRPRGAGDLWTAQVEAARAVGVRLHATRGSMTLSTADDGLAPPELVQDDEEVLADCERLVRLHHDPDPHAMVQMALAPCAPFNVRPELMRATAELAERLDVRLHTHLAEDPDDDAYCRARFGRSPVEHFEDLGWPVRAAGWRTVCTRPVRRWVDWVPPGWAWLTVRART